MLQVFQTNFAFSSGFKFALVLALIHIFSPIIYCLQLEDGY